MTPNKERAGATGAQSFQRTSVQDTDALTDLLGGRNCGCCAQYFYPVAELHDLCPLCREGLEYRRVCLGCDQWFTGPMADSVCPRCADKEVEQLQLPLNYVR
jgi:hypothetical protein